MTASEAMDLAWATVINKVAGDGDPEHRNWHRMTTGQKVVTLGGTAAGIGGIVASINMARRGAADRPVGYTPVAMAAGIAAAAATKPLSKYLGRRALKQNRGKR